MFKITKIIKKGKKYSIEYQECDQEGIILSEEINEFSCIEDQLIEYRLFKNKIFDVKTFEEIIKYSKVSEWLSKAMHYISYKMRTEKEVRQYLKDSELTILQKDSIIKKLYDYHFLNDDNYAKCFIESAIRNGKGHKYINFNLLEKGIDQNVINKYLYNIDDEYAFSVIYEKMKKEVSKLNKYPIKIQKLKLTQKMQRLGFTQNIINKVLTNLDYKEDIRDSIKKDYQKISAKTNDKNKIITYLLSKGYEYSSIKMFLN